jgi:hypothetical protein
MNKNKFDIDLEKLQKEALQAGKKLGEASAKTAVEAMSQCAEALETFTKELRGLGERLDKWVAKQSAEQEQPSDKNP